MGPILIGVLLPVVLGFVVKIQSGKGKKERGVTVDVGGEPGLAKRNHRFENLVEVPWEGATTLAALFEQACKMHASQQLLGTREHIHKEIEMSVDGKPFEKLTLGKYVWISYSEAFDRACNFASGIVALGHGRGEKCAIFAETRADWFIALQVSVLTILLR